MSAGTIGRNPVAKVFVRTVSTRKQYVPPKCDETLFSALTQDVSDESSLDWFPAYDLNATGPLTDEEHAEYLDHRLRGATEAETIMVWKEHERRLKYGSHTGVEHQSIAKQITEAKRYLHLARRFGKYGTVDSVGFESEEPFNG